MNLRLILPAAACGLIMLSSCKKEARLDLSLSDKFEAKQVELVNYTDSTVIASAIFDGGNASIIVPEGVEMPMLVQVMVDGRTRAYYIVEPGRASINDSTSVATGTELNNRFGKLMAEMDSIENLDDEALYVNYAAKEYAANKDNPMGLYFGTELIRFSPSARIDSLLKADAPEALLKSPKVERYRKMAQLREATAPGKKYTDFQAEQPDGKMMSLSQTVKPGNYTVVDFWASWCPYCIKEIPALKELYAKYKDKGFEIVGVAVRDKIEDTKTSVEKHQIPWTVMYNAQRVPYDIYGFTGIPHLMLIGPDGTIISRSESPKKIDERLSAAYASEGK